MKSRLFLLPLALVLAAVIAIGGLSALAKGGPEGPPDDVASEEGDGADNVGDLDGDSPGGDVVAQADGESGEGAEKVAQAIADEFEVDVADVMALHEDGIGFGAIFKLYLLSEATGMSVEELLAEMSNGEGEPAFAFGKWFKDVELPEDAPKNLGKLVSASNHDADGPDGAEASGEDSGSDAGASQGRGHGPPSFAKAKGHR